MGLGLVSAHEHDDQELHPAPTGFWARAVFARDHKVIASAKAITTKGDLAVGVTEAISKAVATLPRGLKPEDISLVSVSTTLATNAVFEGHALDPPIVFDGHERAANYISANTARRAPITQPSRAKESTGGNLNPVTPAVSVVVVSGPPSPPEQRDEQRDQDAQDD